MSSFHNSGLFRMKSSISRIHSWFMEHLHRNAAGTQEFLLSQEGRFSLTMTQGIPSSNIAPEHIAQGESVV